MPELPTFWPVGWQHAMVRILTGGHPGQVVLFTRAKADGSVKVVSVPPSPDTELDAAARQAVSQLRCEPMKVNGKAVDWDLVLTVDFRLKK